MQLKAEIISVNYNIERTIKLFRMQVLELWLKNPHFRIEVISCFWRLIFNITEKSLYFFLPIKPY
jgi:hypothetical protein